MTERATYMHTPGDWETDGVARREDGAIGVFAGQGVACVALVQPGCLSAVGRQDAAKANATLIATAPNLLKELKNALPYLQKAVKFFKYQSPRNEFWPNREELEAIIESVHAEIAKATGEETT